MCTFKAKDFECRYYANSCTLYNWPSRNEDMFLDAEEALIEAFEDSPTTPHFERVFGVDPGPSRVLKQYEDDPTFGIHAFVDLKKPPLEQPGCLPDVVYVHYINRYIRSLCDHFLTSLHPVDPTPRTWVPPVSD